ncbi:MAG TPA: hypothetical protein VFJ85_01435 [Acidimicrobiales bacterium]|nr:hypothetical protein [Acidimicrobiales bacterium]
MQDLSKIGAPKKPQPKSAPKRTKTGRRKPPARALLAVLAVVVAGGAVFYVVGNKSSGVHNPPAKYCDASGRLSSALAAAGVPLEGDLPATVTADSFKLVVRTMGSELDAVSKRAPGSAKPDAKVVVSAVKKAAAGDLTLVRSPEFRRAQVAVLGSGNECLQGSDSGSGS